MSNDDTLRPYQQKAINTILPLIGKQRKILILMPPGTGRHITILHLLYQYSKINPSFNKEKTLIVVNNTLQLRQIEQLATQFFDISDLPNDTNFFIKANPIYITSIHKLQNRPLDTLHVKFDYIVLFDCESALRSNNQLAYTFDNIEYNTIIGVDSSTEKDREISSYFEDITFHYSFKEAIDEGFLLPVRYTQIQIENLALIGGRNTFYNQNNTEKLFFTKAIIENLASSIINLINNEKSLVFCPTIESARKLSQTVNAITKNEDYAKFITSNQSNNDKQFIIKAFSNNELTKLLINVDILSVGISLPFVRKIIFLSHRSERQMVNIISNYLVPSKDKTFLHIIDYADNVLPTDEFGDNVIEVEAFNTKKSDQIIESEDIKFGKSDILFRDRNAVDGVLGVNDIAEELSDIIYKMPFEQGRMIGILGEWGRGKTFLMDQTWKLLDKKKNMIRINFHAWKYQETPAIWAYLYEEFSESYHNPISELNFLRKYWSKFKRAFILNLYRFIKNNGISKFLASILLSFSLMLIISFFEHLESNEKLIGTITITTIIWITKFLTSNEDSIIKSLKKIYSKVSFNALLGSQAEIQKELKHLIKVWSKYNKELKILLFVDDIDRCSEDSIIQIIDSLRIMLDDQDISKRLIVVTAIDERILKRAIRLKYKPLVKDVDSQIDINNLITEYIDKLFLVGIRLGDLIPEEIDEFFVELTKFERSNNEVTEFPKLEEQNKEYNYFEDKEEDKRANSDNNINLENEFDQSVNLEDEVDQGIDPKVEFDQSVNLENEVDQSIDYDKNTTEELTNKLSSVEIDLLRQKLQLFEKITPRQIRIFYYRYLIAKNLLIRQYNKTDRKNIWLQPKYTCIFIELLIEFGKNKDREIISKQKYEILRSKNEICKIELMKNMELKREDYKILLNVLDIVIGY